VGAGLFNPDIVKQVRGQLRGRKLTQGQFQKTQVFYMPVTLLLPAAYFYDCSTCVFNQQATKTCELVAGNIEPYAWCGLWLPKDDDTPFSWLSKAWR
jgi:hypothetical protein